MDFGPCCKDVSLAIPHPLPPPNTLYKTTFSTSPLWGTLPLACFLRAARIKFTSKRREKREKKKKLFFFPNAAECTFG
jgi:hypothetical protein